MLIKRTWLLLFLLFFPIAVLADPAPALDAERMTFDFGEIFQGEKVTHTFAFTNSGDADLVIKRIKTSCGCTAALLSAKTIPPGAEGTIKATFDSGRFRGKVTKTIYFYSNLPGGQPQNFTITGNIRPMVAFEPAQLSFGEVPEGGEKVLSLTLTNAGEEKLQIENIRTANTALHVTTEAEFLLPGVATPFTVAARPIKETAHLRGYVLVRTDNKSLGELRIPVRGSVGR